MYDNKGMNPNFNIVWEDVPGRWTDRDNSANSTVIEVYTSDETAENSRMYEITFFIITGTIELKEDFSVLKRLISQLEEQTNQNYFILSYENELVQNGTEDEDDKQL